MLPRLVFNLEVQLKVGKVARFMRKSSKHTRVCFNAFDFLHRIDTLIAPVLLTGKYVSVLLQRLQQSPRLSGVLPDIPHHDGRADFSIG